ncbi:MAG: GNAT family N-acetyltransferase [Lachnospiraceae bacterium]
MRKAVITWKEDNDNIDFAEVADLLNRAFARTHEPVHKPGYVPPKKGEEEPIAEHGHERTESSARTVFTNSYGVVYALDQKKIVACGRVLSDGLEQAAIYNIAVDPAYQGYGLGRTVIEKLLAQVKGCEVILYTHPQTVKFYETLGFRRQKTGFVIHSGEDFSRFEEEEGFLLPKGYRYETDESDYYDVPPEHTGA